MDKKHPVHVQCARGEFMPKGTLVARADGRFRCKYKGKCFYGKTQAEAYANREHYIDLLKQGLKAEAEGITVREYSGKWLPTHKAGVARRTYNAYANHLDAMNSVIGDKAIITVVPSDIMQVYGLYLSKSESSVHKLKNTMTAMFESAYRDGYIRVNPCTEVEPFKAESGSHRAITDEENELILDTPHPFRLAVLTMRYAGLRRGEVLALQMSDIDFTEKIIHVTKAFRYDGNQPMEVLPKTEAGYRDVPLFSRLEAELKGHKGYIAGKKMSMSAFDSAWNSYVTAIETTMNGCHKRWYGRRKSDKEKDPAKYALVESLIAEAEKARAFGKMDKAKAKMAEAEAVRLEGWKSFTVRPHDLRHSFVTMLCDANVEIDLAMKWVGHSDERMIRRIYDHVSEYRKQKATTDVEALLSGM